MGLIPFRFCIPLASQKPPVTEGFSCRLLNIVIQEDIIYHARKSVCNILAKTMFRYFFLVSLKRKIKITKRIQILTVNIVLYLIHRYGPNTPHKIIGNFFQYTGLWPWDRYRSLSSLEPD